MRVTAMLAAFLAVGAALAGDGADEKKVLRQLQGEWKIVKGQTGGKPFPEEKVNSARLLIDGDKLVITEEGKERKDESTFKIDLSKKPHAIDIHHKGDTEKKTQGIFQLDGDKLKITVARRGGDRPTEFKPAEDAPVTALEFERLKK